MFSVDDLKLLKEQNEKAICENNEIIEQKRSQNQELEAENRVLDKLINIYAPQTLSNC